ncbi:alpha/beta fold hydrolase [Mucilaginibacter sp.]|uniref:RBBP9/YdeN family alpha/beta hydrolase n=1 Tax=Mucilaginibacter sp. TaxID=1882438 RepID=UPI002621D04E|nr:alpha/beta fold hydrolase [Mucilaginibacter sp.]MDB5031560.1 alpha/beta hydrolase [Mucilaginibacter sp.]
MIFKSTILIIPGLGSSGPQHWQSLWERRFNFTRVEQQDWDTPVCADWVEAINNEINKQDPSQVILVGHSLACATIAYWAQKFNTKIKGALLVGPSDTEADTYPTGTSGFKPVLPFPSIAVVSTDDYYVTLNRARLFADSWGSEIINIGDAGHINVASGFGEWDAGLEFLKKLDG